MAILFKQYALTATAADLATALSITDPAVIECKQLIISQNPAATAASYLGGSTVTAVPANAGFIFPLVAANIPSLVYNIGTGAPKSVDLRSIYVIGTVNAANLLFISILY